MDATATRISIAVAGVIAVALPFAGFTSLMLVHFYVRGSFLMDTGLLASLMWHSDAALTMPPSLGGSFFAFHVTPLFLLCSAISRVLPLSMTTFFAGFVGVCHALLALAAFWLLVGTQRLRRGAMPWLACLLALGFAFSGLATAIARYPHFETFLAACFLLFAAALQQRRLGLAALCFVAGLATREDAGLHYAGVLVLAIALNAWRGVPWRQQRAEIGFALAGLLYAGAALAVQRSLFPGADSFTRVYLGDPPLAHLSARLVAMRLLYLVVARPYIVLPAAAACVWALLARNASIALGYLACLPWLLLQLAARSDLAGTLCSYYAFPFLIALGWPLIGARPDRWTAPGFACLLALTFVPATQLHNPGRLSLPADFFAAPSGAERTASDRAVAAVSAARPLLGRLVVDDSVAALAPNGFAKSEVRLWAGDAPPDTVVFLTDGYDAARLRSDAMRHELRWRYVVPGTQLHVASLRPLSDVPGLQGILAPAPDQ